MLKKGSSHGACADEKKLRKDSVRQKKLETSSDELLKEQKNFYRVFTQVASVLEACAKPSMSTKFLFKARRVKGDRRHFGQKIRDSESFADRDKILRDLAAYCYQEGKKFADMGDADTQMKWLKLLHRFLMLSQSLMSDKKFEEELIEMERKVKVIKAAQHDTQI
jgi:hypothetical protein